MVTIAMILIMTKVPITFITQTTTMAITKIDITIIMTHIGRKPNTNAMNMMNVETKEKPLMKIGHVCSVESNSKCNITKNS